MKKTVFITTLLCWFVCTCAFAFELDMKDTTIDNIQTAIKSGEINCVGVITAYLERIKRYNLSTGATAPINAFTAINPVVLDEARELDVSYSQTHQFKGPLHCIPVVIKDNIDTFDVSSTSGSLSLLGNQPIRDAFIVDKIRLAGGIIIGKGAMDEFAAGLIGVSSRSGRTGNAYDPDANPGGSSSGVAAAVASNFAVLGIGTDNSGSIRIPAAFNGLFGLRPSYGLISQSGIFPRGNLDGVAGPIARSVHDLALLLDVIAKEDMHDKKTAAFNHPTSYLDALNENSLQGKRIGIVKSVAKIAVTKGQAKHLASLLHDAQTVFVQRGAVLVPNIELPEFNRNRKNNEAGEYEEINAYLASYPSVRKNYDDICNSDRTHTFGDDSKTCLAFVNGLPKRDSKKYQEALDVFKHNQAYVQKIMEEKKLDALLMPITKTGSATYDIKKINPITLSSNSGLPAITLPIGYDKGNGLPVAIELTGKFGAEAELISMAYAYEQHSAPRVPAKLPEVNNKFDHYSLVELNNLFTRLGYRAYETVLSKGKETDLTPEKFHQMADQVLAE